MFGFMKKNSEKDREEKERKKKEKREKKLEKKSKSEKPPLTSAELHRLEDIKRSLAQQGLKGTGVDMHRGGAVPYMGNDSSQDSSPSGDGQSGDTVDAPRAPGPQTHKIELSKPKQLPPTMPKPHISKPKRGILKGKSNYGPEIPNQGVRGNLDDTFTLEENTRENEEKSGELPQNGKQPTISQLRSMEHRHGGQQHGVAQKIASPQRTAYPAGGRVTNHVPHPQQPVVEVTPAAPSPTEKTFENVDLHLPNLAPPKALKARVVSVTRQPSGDFGFTLRKGVLLKRKEDGREEKETVIFAEPGAGAKGSQCGLLPGDRLIEVNGKDVVGLSRDNIIELIKESGRLVDLTVQPIPELSELSTRSGLDGNSTAVDEQQLKSGTLKRSGSMRFKKGAKSEDELQSEKAWLSAEKVWLVHKGGFAAARILQEGGDLPEGKVKVKLEHGGEELMVDEEDVEKANPPNFDRVEDLATLRNLNESSMLHTLRQRYGSNLIHTYAGQSLLVVNPMHQLSIYSDKVIQMFKGCKQEDMPPHIYAAAQVAYRQLLATKKDQSVVLMGRSGSGKSSSMKHMLQFLTMASGVTGGVLSGERLSAMFTLLDSFGCARTIMNTNATRFTSITTLDFDHAGQVVSASVQVVMFEKTRVARRPEGEPNFNIFYNLLAGIDANLRNELQLQNLSEPNMFMTPLQRAEDRQHATQKWAKIMHAMEVLGITKDEVKAICATLATIYHLGCARVAKGANNKYQFASPAAAQRAASCLGISVEELSRNLFGTNTSLSPKSAYRGASEKGSDHVTGPEALEGFVIGLYNEAFNALVGVINRALSSNYRALASILVVDSPGVQNPATCGRQGGASFEELCYNYMHERLQLLFHDVVFTAQLDRYAQENIECDFETTMMSTPAPMVELIDKPSQQSLVRTSREHRGSDDRGLLWILDEEAIFPGATEDSFMERLFLMHGTRADKKDALLRKAGAVQTFTLNHFQGTNPVMYNVKGWLKAARENPLTRVAASVLQDSPKTEISTLYVSMRGPVSTTVSGSIVGMEGAGSLRRTTSMRRTYQTGAAGIKRNSVSVQVKFQADMLVDMLRRTKVNFVKCILPQHNAGLCDLRSAQTNKAVSPDDIVLNVPLVRHQIRGSEIVDAIRIHRMGFPEQMVFGDFRRRFEILVAPELRRTGAVLDEKQAVEELLEHLDLEKATYRVGLSQIFFRAGALAQLEDAREDKITDFIIKVQAAARWHLAKQKAAKLKVQHMAIACIQRNIKKHMAIRRWPWWRLFVQVKPLLNVHRTEEELRNKDEELEDLRKKVERLEKERQEYKLSCDRMDTKLSEMTAELADEHTTSTQASELLESETSERLRLEREFQELQGRYSNLQRRHETVEMDLYQAQMLMASMDGEVDEEDGGEGDSIFRQKYLRSQREMEMLKKKMEQQHEEEMDKQEAARRQMERKLAEALDDAEAQRRQVGNLRRKLQKTNADMSDMKLHLEEQVTRNADLEKRQRKFDAELHQVSDACKHEKLQREKLQRERDQLSVERYTVEQELKNLKMDREFDTEKIERMEKDLKDLSTHGTKDDNEVMILKRQKHELEQKLVDQEEELDEQAGTIQQLERTKLQLEMAAEKLRQTQSRELEEREEEMETLRFNTQKKLKALEKQLEEEYEEKQAAKKEKQELEQRLKALSEMTPSRDYEIEKRLRVGLKRTKALLRDAQSMLDRQKDAAVTKQTIKQLRDQLEDSQFATASATKVKKSLEDEVQDLQQQLEVMSKAKQEAEDRCMTASREKGDLMTQLEENEEDINEIMKKYKAAVQQQSVDNITITDQSRQIEELHTERQLLKEQVSQLQSQVEFLNSTTVDKQVVLRLEAKIRELEAKLQLEQTSRQRAETNLGRLKEHVESMSEDRVKLQDSEAKHQEAARRLQKQMREQREETTEMQKREAEASLRKTQLEKQVETLESDYEQSQSDLRLAMRRIHDLQAALEEDIDSEYSDTDYLDLEDASETDSEDDTVDALPGNPRRKLSSHYSASRGSLSSTDESLRPRTSVTPSSSDVDIVADLNDTREGEAQSSEC